MKKFYQRRRSFTRTMCTLIALSLPAQGSATTCPAHWPPPNLPKDLPCPVDHRVTVEMEHRDRINRLLRLSKGSVQPRFETEYLFPDEHRQKNYPIDIPVLRVSFDTEVFFDTARSEVRIEAFPVLRIIADNLAKEPADVALYIVGHTDSVGNEDYNYNLGLSRANAVAEALARRGIYQASIYRLSLGEGYPIADNLTSAGRSRNRRVEFLFGATSQTVETLIRRIAVQPCIATDENGVATCKRPVKIDIKKVSVNLESAAQVAELNRRESALEAKLGVDESELHFRRQDIELRRQRIAIKPERSRVAVMPIRRLATHDF